MIDRVTGGLFDGIRLQSYSSKGTPNLDIVIIMNFLVNSHLYTLNKMI